MIAYLGEKWHRKKKRSKNLNIILIATAFGFCASCSSPGTVRAIDSHSGQPIEGVRFAEFSVKNLPPTGYVTMNSRYMTDKNGEAAVENLRRLQLNEYTFLVEARETVKESGKRIEIFSIKRRE